MRFIFIIILFLSSTIKAQDIFILDSITNTPVENANLITQFTGVSSDINGLVNLIGFNNTDTIMIKHISLPARVLRPPRKRCRNTWR